MSGVAAVWNLDGRPLSRSVFEKVLGPLRPHSGRIGTWREGAISLGLAPTRGAPDERQPLVGSDGVVLTFHGRLDDRHGLVHELGRLPEADELMSDASLVLASYAKWGDDLCDHLVGDFAMVLFDPRRQWLLLARDLAGTRPLHYLHLPETMVVASRAEAILAHPGAHAAPNEAHLSRLVLGGPPQHDTASATPFEGIHSVPPGHVAVLTRGRFAIRRFRDPLVTEAVPPTKEDAARALAGALDAAVARRLRRGSVLVQLDGWASGSLLGAAIRAGSEVLAAVPDGAAAPIAAQVIRTQRGAFPTVAAATDCVVAGESPRLDPVWTSHRNALGAAVDRGATVVLSSLGAEEMLGDDAYLADLVAHLRLREAFARVPGSLPARTKHVADVAARGLTPPSLRQPARGVRAYVAGPLRDADWYTSSFYRWAARPSTREAPSTGDFATHAARGIHEQARSASLLTAVEQEAKMGAAAGLEVAFPFLDPQVVACLMATPQTQRPVGGDLSVLLPVPPTPPATPSVDELIGDWAECVRRLTRVSVAVEAGYVESAMLRSELPYLENDIREGDADSAARLLDLLGLELWLERFSS